MAAACRAGGAPTIVKHWEVTIRSSILIKEILISDISSVLVLLRYQQRGAESEANVVALVSKMFAVPDSDLPENKKQPVTAEELRNRAKALREAKRLAEEQGEASISSRNSPTPPEPEAAPTATNGPGETLLGFARIYSGTIVEGAKVYCVLPKYNHSLGPLHPRNQEHLTTASVERLYTMMGRELVQVSSVHAGNVFAVKGLEGKVWRNATLCAPNQSGIGDARLRS